MLSYNEKIFSYTQHLYDQVLHYQIIQHVNTKQLKNKQDVVIFFNFYFYELFYVTLLYFLVTSVSLFRLLGLNFLFSVPFF